MERVGKYELVRKLARGGMAEVFLARAEWARGLDKTVVVKRILPQWASEPRFIEMFFSEAKLASQLSHPNIAQIIEFGEADGASFLAMEYVDGPSLRALYKAVRASGERMPFGHCARIIACACEALAYAHDLTDSRTGQALQLVHRDVSPDNILISRAGAVKLADFGIAKAVTQTHHTKTGVVKGKLPYLSPEQVRAEPLDRRADIFSLGVVLYELLAGAKPYDTANELELIRAIGRQDRVPLSARRPDTPPQLERIVSRAMERDRDQRYPDCRVMHAELEQFLISIRQPVSAFQIAEMVERYTPEDRVTSEERPRATDGVRTDTDTPIRSPETSTRRAPRVAALAGAVVGLVVLASAAVLLWPGSSAPPPAVAAPVPIRATPAPAPGPTREELEAAEEVSYKKKIDWAADELKSGHYEAAEELLAESKRTTRYAAEWKELRALLDSHAVKAPSSAPRYASNPKEEEANQYFEEGKSLLRKRQYDEAQALFLKCLEADRKNFECHLALGSTYARLRQPEKGAQHYLEFLRLAPNHAQADEVRKLLEDYQDQRRKQR